MQLFIHGTKDGYRRLFETDENLAYYVAKDVRKGTQGDEQVGKSAFSIAFTSNGTVFTMHVIVKDSLRSFATGTIAFSLFLRNEEKMKAADVLRLLNELYQWYDDNYIKDHCLNRGETTLILEDWSFIQDILFRYKGKVETRSEDVPVINSGNLEPAFIYYEDDRELLNYFDKPYQEEYAEFSQVFFIDERLRGIQDPLNVFKNCGRELNYVDLDNDTYFLSNFHQNQGLSIYANDKPRSGGRGENSIRKKDLIQISYQKDERYFKPLQVEGRLSEQNSKIAEYLEVRAGNQLAIRWDCLKLDVEGKDNVVTFQVKDRKGKPVEGIKIICVSKSGNPPKSFKNYTITFRGEELQQVWYLSVKKGDKYFLEDKRFIPEADKAEITLGEYKIVNFIVKDAGNKQSIKNFQIKIDEQVRESRVEFFDEQIDNKHKISIQSEGYKDLSTSFRPSKDDPTFELKKIEASKGLWSKVSSVVDKPRLIAGVSAILLLVSIGVVWLVINSNKTPIVPIEQIVKYVEGLELDYDTLKVYEASVNYQLARLDKSNAFFDMFKSDVNLEYALKESKTDALKNKLKIIEGALTIRSAISNGEVDKLKSLSYSKKQERFKDAIDQIDSNNIYYDDIVHKVKLLKNEDLDRIADSILVIIQLQPIAKVTSKEQAEKSDEKIQIDNNKEQPVEKVKPVTSKESQENIIADKPKVPNGLTSTPKSSKSEIAIKLKGGDITKDELKRLRDDESQKEYHNSIQLYLEFWASIKGGMQMEDSQMLLERIKSDQYLRNSDLKGFLQKVCADSESFKKYNETGGKASKQTINQLKSHVNP